MKEIPFLFLHNQLCNHNQGSGLKLKLNLNAQAAHWEYTCVQVWENVSYPNNYLIQWLYVCGEFFSVQVVSTVAESTTAKSRNSKIETWQLTTSIKLATRARPASV